MNTYTIFI